MSHDRWTGAGLTIIDPSTGAGAYTIEGGTNGGWIELDGEWLGLLEGFAIGAALGVIILSILAISLFGLLAITLTALAIWIGVYFLASETFPTGSSERAFMRDLASGVIITLILFAIFGGTVAAVIAGLLLSLLYVIWGVFIYTMIYEKDSEIYARIHEKNFEILSG